jgi:HlyD family secretion protein
MWKRIVVIVVIIAVAGGGYFFWQRSQAAKAKKAEPEIETAKVERKDLTVTVSASGVIEALTTVEVKSRSGGEVARMYVEAGDAVQAGQLLAQIDPTQIRNKVQQASAQMEGSQASTAQARLSAALQAAQTGTEEARSQASLEAARANVEQAAEQLRQEKETVASNLQRAEASLAATRARLAQAEAQSTAQPRLTEAEVASARASLQSSRQNLARVKSGPRTEEIAQAEASVRSAEAAVKNAAQTLARQQALLAQGYVARQTVDDAQKTHDQAMAQRDSAAENLALLRAGNRAEDIAQAEAQVAQAEASLKLAETNAIQVSLRQQDAQAARESVREGEAALATARAQQRNVAVRQQQLEAARASVRQAEAALQQSRNGKLETRVRQQQVNVALAEMRRRGLELANAMDDLRYTSIFAPRSGVIMQKFVEEGTVIPAGTAALREGTGLVSIADTSEMFVLADVDESDMAPVKEGQAVQVVASVLPDEKLKGKVVKIFPLGVTEQNVVRFKVRVKIDNPPPSLRPGMTADVTIMVAERKQVLVVPDLTITRNKGADLTVEILAGPQKPEKRTVRIGLSNWEETEVISGLKEGEVVIIPPPPGSEPPPWLAPAKKDDKKAQAENNKRRMMQQFQGRGR